ncbi:hypothetical protein BJ166DRAFT_269771 [Pestalotiopsis sp. NC0098]|nr:hypothetical protein BJ166DRAFT_269771 [Pestalotiopsis sp. NC0098]
MAEVVAFGASVVAFIQLADRVVEITKYYIEAIKDCPSDLKAILVEVSLLRAVLHSLEFVLQANKDDSTGSTFLGHLAGADGPIEMCRKALVALEKLLPSDFHAAQGKRQKVRSAAAHLAWPLRESSAKKLLDTLSRYRASITFAITCDVMRDIKDIQHDVRQLNDKLDFTTLSEFCNWLQSTNPSMNHNSAWELREDNTGLWMTDSKEWKQWLEGKEKFLWIHGIPGAGKTVLASYLVEQTRLHCQNRAPMGHLVSLVSPAPKPIISVYYYCYFARNQDEAAHFLRWLLSQLCRRVMVIPNDIHAIHQSSQLPSI